MARSMTNSAVIASWSKAATNFIVFQWPHGTCPTTGSVRSGTAAIHPRSQAARLQLRIAIAAHRLGGDPTALAPHHNLIDNVAIPTPNTDAARRRDTPLSTAQTTRSRKSH
jgi:hypothetical protein